MLPGLTGLRGIGALWVVTYHAQYGMHIPVARAGFLGVDLFFILSGFVLSHTHSNMNCTWTEYLDFLQNRFARIFPLHWFALGLVLLALACDPKLSVDLPRQFEYPDLFWSFLLMQNWGLSQPIVWNSPAWSLSTEWMASIIFPLFLVPARCISRIGPATLCCGGCLAALAALLLLTSNPDTNVIGRAGIARTLCEFGSGCLLYRVYLTGVNVNRFAVFANLVAISIGILVPTVSLVAVAGFPVLILLAAKPLNLVSRLCSTRILLFFGQISFSIYLLHSILLQLSNRLEAYLDVHGAGAFVWFLCFLTFIIGLSAMTYRLVETPSRRWLRVDKTSSRKAIAGQ